MLQASRVRLSDPIVNGTIERWQTGCLYVFEYWSRKANRQHVCCHPGLERLCNGINWHYGVVKADHRHGAIPLVKGSQSGVQLVEQERNKTNTDHLLSKECECPSSWPVYCTGYSSGGAHVMLCFHQCYCPEIDWQCLKWRDGWQCPMLHWKILLTTMVQGGQQHLTGYLLSLSNSRWVMFSISVVYAILLHGLDFLNLKGSIPLTLQTSLMT